ncbi:MAG TPA: flagellar protein FlaG [Nitrospira sp.]|nr:flagellar protein FlaG [Nitrospira sp.]
MVQDVTQKPDLPLPAESRRPVPSSEAARPAAGRQQAPAAVAQKDISEVIKRVSEALQQAGPQLQMEVDSDLGRVIVKVIDRESGKLIRQIPEQELVNLAKQLKSLNGLLVKKHA